MTNVRDAFLTECSAKKTTVTMFTTNGVQIKGVISTFDSVVVVLLRDDGRKAMVFQSAISTIMTE